MFIARVIRAGLSFHNLQGKVGEATLYVNEPSNNGESSRYSLSSGVEWAGL